MRFELVHWNTKPAFNSKAKSTPAKQGALGHNAQWS